MRRRKDPPGYPGDEYITQRFYEMKDALRESAGMTREELEKAIVAAWKNSLQHTAPIRRAMGTRIRHARKKTNLTRSHLPALSNLPSPEIASIYRLTNKTA